VALLLVVLQSQRGLASDTVLGIVSHTALAAGLLALTALPTVRVDLQATLMGDVLAVSKADLAWIWGGGGLVGLALLALWRPLLAVTVDADLARVDGVPAGMVRLAFTLLIALVVAVAMKVVGVLLITALLVIPAAAARRLAPTPEAMAAGAAAIGAASVAAGLFASLHLDLPAGPAIVMAGAALFALIQLAAGLRRA
jgi:zinc transport system permease protein